jgi:archaeal flagellar protein FlaG
MSAETITTAMFLITAVVASGVLINAIFPVIYQTAGTFSSSTHASDVRLRTDFVIVTTFANHGPPLSGQVWMKNIGSQPVSGDEIQSSDVFFGKVGNFQRLDLKSGQWSYHISDLNGNGYWDPGETLEIDTFTADTTVATGGFVYYQFVLPDGIWRSNQFTAS